MAGKGVPVSARRTAPACRRCGHERGGHPSCIPGGSEPAWCTTGIVAGTCKCWQYIPQRPWTRFLAWLRERPPPVTADMLHPRPVPFHVRDRSDDGWDEHRTQLNIPRARPYADGGPR